MTYIYLWEYNNVFDSWSMRKTSDVLESKDEEKYFRVLRNTDKTRGLEKHFYNDQFEYINHLGKTIDLSEYISQVD
jgi:hypothetical protein